MLEIVPRHHVVQLSVTEHVQVVPRGLNVGHGRLVRDDPVLPLVPSRDEIHADAAGRDLAVPAADGYPLPLTERDQR